MIYKLQAQSGSCRRSMWCGAAEHTGMPSPSEQDDWCACTFFLSGQRSRPDERYGLGILGRRHIELGRLPYGGRKFGHPCAEKVRPHRPRQSFGSSGRTFAPLESAGLLNRGRSQDQRKALPPKTMASEPDACAGVGSPWQGTLTITGSNVRLGTEMPVALSLSFV